MTDADTSIRLVDWRQVGADLLRPCYARELEYWREVLGWDTEWTWATVEEARVTWGLPGVVALDPVGRAIGWSFHLIEDRVLRIGGLVADSARTTRAIVSRILEQATTDGLHLVSCFIAERADGLRHVLETHHCACETFDYLWCDLTGLPDAAPHRAHVSSDPGWYEQWDGDAAAAADLLAAAYQREAALHFTTGGTLEEWRRYVRQLVEQPACGTLDQEGTLMVRDRNGLAALALVTALAPETAHLAQMAVRPDCQGRGLARRLLDAAMRRAASRGRTAMTLLVGETNHAAARVYARAGFRPRAAFLAGRLPLDRR